MSEVTVTVKVKVDGHRAGKRVVTRNLSDLRSGEHILDEVHDAVNALATEVREKVSL